MAEESMLYRMVVDDISQVRASRFLRGYLERSDIIYKVADSLSFGDDAVHEAYAPYHNGQVRFTLHQSMFIKLAEDCKLKWEISRCPQNGFPSAVVRIGRFYFTDHYGTGSHDITCLNPSLMRSQNAEVNLRLTQGSLFEGPFDDRKLRGADNIYGNFIHGCRGTGKDFAVYGFARLAFPCATNAKTAEEAQSKLRFVETHNLYDVLESVVARENQDRSSQRSVRIVVPKIKKQQ